LEEAESLYHQTLDFDFIDQIWLLATPFCSGWPVNWLSPETLFGMWEPMLGSLPSRQRTEPAKPAK
jgi:hypothetical protein